MRLIALLLTASLLLSCKQKKANIPFTTENAIAVATPEATYIDSHYQFKIEGLSQQWKLLNTKEISAIIPDAVAGGISTQGTYTAIIVEPIGDSELESFTRLIHENMTLILGSAEEIDIREGSTGGQPSQHFTLDAVVSEIEFHYECSTVIYKGFAYQLLTWFSPGDIDLATADVEGFTSCFTFLDGQPTLPPITTLPDSDDVGSRLRNGRFESGVFKFAVNPSENWRILHGAPLVSVSVDAEVALEAPHEGMYITITASHLGRSKHSDIIEAHREIVEDSTEDPSTSGSITLSIQGKPVELHRYTVAGDITATFYSGVHIHENTVLHLDAWYLGAKENVPELIGEALSGIEYLSTDQSDKISSDLAGNPYIRTGVGSNFCLRSGSYRNFDDNYLWKQPHHLWRVETGDAALARNPDCALYATDLHTNIAMQIISEPASDFTPTSFHDVIMTAMKENEPEGLLEPLSEVTLSNVTFQQSRITTADEFSPITYRVVTTVTPTTAYQMILWSSPEIMEDNQDAILAAAKGFSISSTPLTRTKSSSSQYSDFRLGWRLRFPGSGWSQKSIPFAFDALGTYKRFSDGRKSIEVLALHLERSADAGPIVDALIHERLQVNLDRSSSKGTSKSTGTIAGQNATIITGADGKVSVRMATFTNNETLWMLIIGAPNDRTAKKLFKDLDKNFSLLP